MQQDSSCWIPVRWLTRLFALQETPGEDPLVNGVYAEDFISHIQGTTATDWADPRAAPLKAAATIKHFLACAYTRFLSGSGTSEDVAVQMTSSAPAGAK